MMHVLANMFIGLVAIMTFVIVLRALGWLAVKIELVQDSQDSNHSNYIGIGCGLLMVIFILCGICWFIGSFIGILTTFA